MNPASVTVTFTTQSHDFKSAQSDLKAEGMDLLSILLGTLQSPSECDEFAETLADPVGSYWVNAARCSSDPEDGSVVHLHVPLSEGTAALKRSTLASIVQDWKMFLGDGQGRTLSYR